MTNLDIQLDDWAFLQPIPSPSFAPIWLAHIKSRGVYANGKHYDWKDIERIDMYDEFEVTRTLYLKGAVPIVYSP
jgi:hypothetical protein